MRYVRHDLMKLLVTTLVVIAFMVVANLLVR
jgi:hypothetical protein